MENFILLDCEFCNATGTRHGNSDGMDYEYNCDVCGATGQEKMTRDNFYTFLEQRNNESNKMLRENQELKAWKESEISINLPLIEFMQAHPDCKVGNSIIQKSIEFIKERDNLKARNQELLEALKKAQAIIQSSAIEAERVEIQRFLSGGYLEKIQNACFKDSLGIDALLNKSEPK